MAHGKHVLVEKPIALSVADANAVVAEGRRRGRLVATISQRRFEPVIRALHDAVAAGAFGRISLIVAEGLFHRPQSYYDSGAWRGTLALDGGVLMNQAIHMVDLLRWMGGPIDSVVAHVATLGHRMETEDTASVSLRFTSGALGAIIATTCATPEFPVQLRIYGDAGHVRIVGEDPVEWVLPGIEPPVPGEQTEGDSARSATWGTNAIGYVRQYSDFIAAVRGDRPPAVTGEDGRNAVEVVTAACESSRKGRVVEIRGAG